jgi:hypothetical protein
VDRHDRAVVLLDLLFAQGQVSHKGHVEVALNHPGVKVSEIGGQAKEDTWAERRDHGWRMEKSEMLKAEAGPRTTDHRTTRGWGEALKR